MPAPVSTRITAAPTTTTLPAFGFAGTVSALPAFRVTGSSLSRLSVGEEQPEVVAVDLAVAVVVLAVRALRERQGVDIRATVRSIVLAEVGVGASKFT